MTRWIVGALAATLLLYPAQALAQFAKDGMNLSCLAIAKFSVATFLNVGEKQVAMCRWKCVWETKSGGTHINQGAYRVAFARGKIERRGATDLVRFISQEGSCR